MVNESYKDLEECPKCGHWKIHHGTKDNMIEGCNVIIDEKTWKVCYCDYYIKKDAEEKNEE